MALAIRSASATRSSLRSRTFWQVIERMVSAPKFPEGGGRLSPHGLDLTEHRPIHSDEIRESHHIGRFHSSG